MTIFEGFTGFQFVYALGWTIIHSLWQCGIIGLVLAAVFFLGGRLSSNTRYWFSFIALLLCVVFSVTTFLLFFRDVTEVRLTVGGEVPSPGMLFIIQAKAGGIFAGFSHFIENNLVTIVLLWAVGCVIYLVRYLGEYYYCHTLKHTGVADLPEFWERRIEALHKKANLFREVNYKISYRISVPCVIGHFKPVVLLPAGMLSGLSREQVEMILLHEIGHIRRNDYLLGLVQASIKILYFFNPAALWISSCIDAERENSSDDFAIQMSGDALLYAKTLKECAEMNTKSELALAIIKNKNHLLMRITRLFEQKTMSPNSVQGLMAALCVALCFSVVSVYAGSSGGDAQSEVLEFTSISPDQVKKLVSLAKAQWQKDDEVIRFDLKENPDYEAMSDAEKLLFARLVGLSTAPEFSNLSYEKALEFIQWQSRKKDFSSYSEDINRVVTFHPENSNDELARAFVYPEPDKYKMTLTSNLIEKMRTGQVASLVHDAGMLVEIDEHGTIVLTVASQKLGGDNLGKKSLEFVQAVKDNYSGRGYDPEKNPERVAAYQISLGLPNDHDRKQHLKARYDDHMHLYAYRGIVQVQIPPKVVDYLISSEFGLGDATFGGKMDNERDLVVTVDVTGNRARNKEIWRYISDKAVKERPISPDLQARIDALSEQKKQYLFTDEEYEKMRLSMGKLKGRSVGKNEFSHVKVAYTQSLVDFLENVDDKGLADLLKQPRFFMGSLADKAHFMIREPIHDENNKTVFAMEVYRESLDKVVEMASDNCPSEAEETALADPKSQVIVEFTNLTCKQAFDVFAALDVRYD